MVGKIPVEMAFPLILAPRKQEAQPSQPAALVKDAPFHQELFEDLRNLRRKLAEDSRMPPYMIFHDEVLKEISRQLPASPQELVRIRGIGKRKLQQWGSVVLDIVKAFRKRHPSAAPSFNTLSRARNEIHLLAPGPPSTLRHAAFDGVPAADRSANARVAQKSADPTTEETWRLWQGGKTLFQIAEARSLTRHTVTGHLLELMAEGRQIDLSRIIPTERRKQIEAAIAIAGIERLKPIKELLPDEVSYEDIRLVVGELQLKLLH
jgi:ATP-dependent DNA helicase RecQ